MSKITSRIGWGILDTICVVIFLLNVLAGVVAGVWLAFKGEWHTIGLGLAASFSMPLIWWIVLLPSLGLVTLMGRYEPNDVRFAVVSSMNTLYQSLACTAWVLLIFIYFTEAEITKMSIPMVLWGYSVATSPIIYIASHETSDNIAASATVFLSEVSYILLAVLSLCGIPLKYSLGVLASLVVANTFLLLVLWRKLRNNEM